jgi:hypothetical protein
MRQSGNIEKLSTEAESKQMQMRAKYTQREGMGELKILDVGEGWGSIGIAVSEIPGCATIGVDRVGFLDQGERFGKITSRVHLDLCSEGRRNVLRRAAKMASRTLESFLMVWMSPECRILTAANAMNVRKGCVNGHMITDPRNSKMSTVTKEKKQEELKQCNKSIANQIVALREETGLIWFAMENPTRSHLWEMEEVRTAAAEEGWKLIEVDQCAYGRKCRKPTKIMTNIPWEPEGFTGKGRCIIGKCGGTMKNKLGPGQGRHEQQMITSDATRKPREGELVGSKGRREFSVKAGKNLVQSELVKEIVIAAMVAGRPEGRKRKDEGQRGNREKANSSKRQKGK